MKDWIRPAAGPAEHAVGGDDAALRRAATTHAGRLLAFQPSPQSDLGRALGLLSGEAAGRELVLDRLRITDIQVPLAPAVNAIVIGRAPRSTRWARRATSFVVDVDGARVFAGRATGVVVATGQFLHGDDVNPRSHPGDGRFEVYVFALRPAERAGMRRRLATGTHVPHRRIIRRAGRTATITTGRLPNLEIDGEPVHVPNAGTRLEIAVDPASLRLLV